MKRNRTQKRENLRERVQLYPASEAWNRVPWRKLEQHVFRIQKRIYRASQQEKTRTVQKLQKLLMKSEAARMLAVRRVTQDNHGKRTAGVDGVKFVYSDQRLDMVKQIHPKQWKLSKPKPVRRIWIPKPGKVEKRPLGIPTMLERSKQALIKMALEPEWEARFETNSYGFRPGRSCHDAIAAIFSEIRLKPKFVLDADIKGCFDNINQEELLKKLQTFSQMRQIIRKWLKAGVLDNGVFTPTEMGTPQGGVISPLLANIALHGMEKAVAVGNSKKAAPALIRYADDFVILHHDKIELEKATQKIIEWLKDIGLTLSTQKTRITHTLTPYEGNVGFDFLGFTVRQFHVGKTHTGKNPQGKPLGFKTIIKPSKEAIKRHIRRTNQEIRALKSAPQRAVIVKLNQIIPGWCNYYKAVVATKVFSQCDHYLYLQLMSWSNGRHAKKGKRWIRDRYWQREDGKRWIFMTTLKTEKDLTHLKLRMHSQTHIQRHIKVRGNISPYNGDLLYWSKRLTRHPLMRNEKAKLLQIQKGQCPRCRLYFKDEDLLEIDHIQPIALGGKNTIANKWLYHRHCHDEKTVEDMARLRALKEANISNR